MDAERYWAALKRCGGAHAELPLKERSRAIQAWREVYAAPLYRRTGSWKNGSFEWHVFSHSDARALNGARAEAAYAAERPRRLLVVPEAEELAAVTIELPRGKKRRPDFATVDADVYIWPPNLAWTMAFTHEHYEGLGPYFSRREWVR